MAIRRRLAWTMAALVAVGTVGLTVIPATAEGESGAETSAPRAAKPLSETTSKGLAYLVNQQHADGGWGQGGGWRINTQGGGRVDGGNAQDPSDVGNTCIATLALIRAGHTPGQGAYAKNVERAVEFITKHVDQADDDSLYVTPIRDTQLQQKIGRYVDTFLAALVLSELKGKLPDSDAEGLVLASLEKAIKKIEKNQQANGNFAGNAGWASTLSMCLCSKAINRARQSGVQVAQEALDRDFDGAVAAIESKKMRPKGVAAGRVGSRGGGVVPALSGRPVASARVVLGLAGDAGVDLYSDSSNVGRLQELANTNEERKREAKRLLLDESAPKEAKDKARLVLNDVLKVEKAKASAVNGILGRLDDKGFIAGFGNNGGEEFLSYMNISETLVVDGGEKWNDWDQSITKNLEQAQNQDGSWSGHHCITGRTFCTAAALLTLMADRAPIPESPKADAEKVAVRETSK
ncbi:Prenyltransferase and squalene oxidase repeat protein [Planctomycetes bacterium Pan216]|uniref:Prenyltransferase and squalene oxidase repeat protein n=1 Tax=Kolteria novifilia TaxID=2527975 RepID=A0A518B3F1_9BACT|nr:Prenyltransferase and squalene oxidase repeat protein [Planctomycetes bacterium Pan216]